MEPMIDKSRLGEFISTERRRLGLTQKELADQLYVSGQAVSKWERGLSLPDVQLLTPLAKSLEVTVTELLAGRRLPAGERMEKEEVEHLVKKVLGFFPVIRIPPWMVLLLADTGLEWCLFSCCLDRVIRYAPFALPLRLLLIAIGYFLPERQATKRSNNVGPHFLLFLIALSMFSMEIMAILFWDHPDKGPVFGVMLYGTLLLLFLAGIILTLSKTIPWDIFLFHHFMAIEASILVLLSDLGILMDYKGRDYLMISNSLLTYLISVLALCILAFLKKRKSDTCKQKVCR